MKYKGKKLRAYNNIIYKNPVLIPLPPGSHGLTFGKNADALFIGHKCEKSFYDSDIPKLKQQEHILNFFASGGYFSDVWMEISAAINLLGHHYPKWDPDIVESIFPIVATKYMSGEALDNIKSLNLPRPEELVEISFSQVQSFYLAQLESAQQEEWFKRDKKISRLAAKLDAINASIQPRIERLEKDIEAREIIVTQEKRNEIMARVMDEVNAKMKK